MEFGALQGSVENLRLIYELNRYGSDALDLSRDRREQRVLGYGTAAVTYFFPTGLR